MRKGITVYLSILIGICLLGCAPAVAETPDAKESMVQSSESSSAVLEVPEGTELKVYYYAKDSASAQIIKDYKKTCADSGLVFQSISFSDPDEMDVQIAADLKAGEGPDVILFPEDTTLDTLKMAHEGSFMDLNAYMEADGRYVETEYYPVLDAGIVNGEQVLMPLRFRCHYLMSSAEKLEREEVFANASYDEAGKVEYTMSELMHGLTNRAEQCDEESSAMQIMYSNTIGGLLYDNLRLTGVELVDPESGNLSVSKEVFTEYADYTKMTYEQIVKSSVILKLYSKDFAGAFLRLTTLAMNGNLPYNARQYDAFFAEGLEENIKLLPLPNYRNSKELTADISLYAAVPAGCQVPEIAYEFVRFAMDGETAVDGELSVNRSCVQAVLDELSAQHGITIRMGSKEYHIYKMREEVRTQCEEILGRIAAGHIRSAGVEDIFTEIMEGYITGTEEWDDQYEEMKERLEAY